MSSVEPPFLIPSRFLILNFEFLITVFLYP